MEGILIDGGRLNGGAEGGNCRGGDFSRRVIYTSSVGERGAGR